VPRQWLVSGVASLVVVRWSLGMEVHAEGTAQVMAGNGMSCGGQGGSRLGMCVKVHEVRSMSYVCVQVGVCVVCGKGVCNSQP